MNNEIDGWEWAEINMTAEKLLATISRDFFRAHNIDRYRMHKIDDLADQDAVRNCHWYCEEEHLTAEFNAFRKNAESAYRYCACLEEYIDDGLCCDVQMIALHYIKSTALPERTVDWEKAQSCCNECRYRF